MGFRSPTKLKLSFRSIINLTVKFHTRLYSNNPASIRSSTELFELEKTYAGLFRAFTETQSISNGKALHCHILKTMPRPRLFLSNSLANVYSKCQSVDDARQVFDEMLQPDVVSWNTIIDGYFLSGLRSDAFAGFREMLRCGVAPDEFSFTRALKSCSSYRDFGVGLWIHCVIIKYGLGNSAFVANGLVEFYAKFGLLGEMMKVFDMLECKDIVLVNTVIGLLAKAGNFGEAFVKFRDYVLAFSMVPNRATFVNLLGGINGYESLRQGIQVHCLAIKLGFESDDAVENILVRMYCDCGFTNDAFDLLVCSDSKSVVSWTSLIDGYANLGCFQDALEVFYWICHEGGLLDDILLVCILGIAATSGCLQLGIQLHSLILKYGFESNSCIRHALMDMYAKCISMEDAQKIFQQLGKDCSVLSWTTIISGYVYNGFSMEALRSFYQMNREGFYVDSVSCISVLTGCTDLQAIDQGKQAHAFVIKSGCETDISVQTALLSLYADCGCLTEATKLFRMMRHDVVSWTALISAYAKLGYSEEALVWLVRMLQDGLKPNHFTFACALTASTKLTSSEIGKSLHAAIIKTGLEEDTFIGSALIDMYSKCGSMKSAVNYFTRTSKHDLILWNALLSGHAQHGNIAELLKAYNEMIDLGVKPDGITFLAVLTGCSHGGLVHKVIQYYTMMWDDFRIRPEIEHCACVVDALGRAGLFKEAVDFIQRMGFTPGSTMLRSLISSCINYGYVALGLAAVAKMVMWGMVDGSTYVLLSNLYAVEERWVDRRTAREAMEIVHINVKKVGKSWIAC
ncbi:pentatricopeptide repeat-containing protein At2g33680-like [Phoenix dactylifera]|uniref:Pentatricopeptide repeat-containing protein At2g33680-like n=1 Tax=Phoenix dactylifera TaxID=42345 RepID=A0A8B9AFS2_PHODC|nr:pentatricopeptide repeat-containing protein At2g33680-like [Phoenix dactylifera]